MAKRVFKLTIPSTSSEMSASDLRKLLNLIIPEVFVEEDSEDVQYFVNSGVLTIKPDPIQE